MLKILELYPIWKPRTKVIKLFGEDRYTVDLAQGHDLFVTLIDARIDVPDELADELTSEDHKASACSERFAPEGKQAKREGREAFLESFQNGL